VRRLGPLVLTLGDRVQRNHYLQQLARLVQVDERTLAQQIRPTPAARRSPAPVEPDTEAPAARSAQDRKRAGLDEYCLAATLAHPELLERVDEALSEGGEGPFQTEDLTRTDDRAILAAWRDWLADAGASEERPAAAFADVLDESLQDRIAVLAQMQEEQPQAPDELLRAKVLEAALRLRLRTLYARNQELHFLQQDAQATGESEAVMAYGKLTADMWTRIGRLEKALEGRSMMGRRRRFDAAVRVPLTEE